jgi:hypothetical protein
MITAPPVWMMETILHILSKDNGDKPTKKAKGK